MTGPEPSAEWRTTVIFTGLALNGFLSALSMAVGRHGGAGVCLSERRRLVATRG